MRRLISY